MENKNEKVRGEGVNIRKQVRDAWRVRPGDKLACLERQCKEAHAMEERSEKRKNR
jgi:hypothetical protein